MTRRITASALALCAAALIESSARGQDAANPHASADGSALANGPVQLFLQETRASDAASPLRDTDASDANSAPSPHNPHADDRPLTTPRQESKGLGPKPAAVQDQELDREKSAPNAAALTSDFTLTDIARVLGALGAVLGLAWTIRSIIRRTHGMGSTAPRPSGVVEILARYPVPGSRGPSQDIILIKIARRVIVAHSARGSAGPTMTALCEITNADEVASLLGRLEAGAAPRQAGKFREALSSFQAEPAAELASHRSPSARTGPGAGVREADRIIGAGHSAPEIVDLTRNRSRGLLAWLGGGNRA